ncbi:MAG: hypothetical protein IJ418_10985 [Clostridia bacterium]|nr:hypothetical protein [Clostridia bacterium]
MLNNPIREKLHIGLLCLIASCVLLLLCSQCSPLYPINVWGDANCLLTVGRVMKEGGVVYRDIYEQKGPTLYLIHAIAACISDNSFFGVYVMEVISFTAVLFMACRLGMRKRSAWAASCDAVLFGACLLAGSAFSRGDSAEEFCLPYLMGALTLAFRHYGKKSGPMPLKALFACGLMAGMVATIKFTILGLFVGLCIAEGMLALREGGMKCAMRSAVAFLAGMLLPIAVWCAYFAAHGALGDFYTAYIHNNIFLYSDETRTILDAAHDIWDTVRDNALWVLLCCTGFAAFMLDRREKLQLRLAALSMAVCAFAAVYFLGRTWPYSPLVLGVFGFALFPSAVSWMDRMKRAVARYALGVITCALALAVAALLSPNAYLRGVPLGDLAQARLAGYVHEGATLLQYSHLDDGLYLVADRLPQQKYFVRLNVNYDEMYAELDRYVKEAIPDYVLTAWVPLPEEFDQYRLIATDAGYDDRDRINKLLYLYRRK